MISALITLVVYLLVLGILWYLIDYVIRTLPVPDPPARIIRILLVVIFCIIVIVLLLNLIGVSTGVSLPRIS
jgi:hypothetical protein